MIAEEVKRVIVLVNKWDAVDKDAFTIYEYQEKLHQDLNFILTDPSCSYLPKQGSV